MQIRLKPPYFCFLPHDSDVHAAAVEGITRRCTRSTDECVAETGTQYRYMSRTASHCNAPTRSGDSNVLSIKKSYL